MDTPGPSVGYTCGLWELFHVISVGVAERATPSNNAPINNPFMAGETMREFVANFFPCAECQIHFLQMYDGCMFKRCDSLVDSTSPEMTLAERR